MTCPRTSCPFTTKTETRVCLQGERTAGELMPEGEPQTDVSTYTHRSQVKRGSRLSLGRARVGKGWVRVR